MSDTDNIRWVIRKLLQKEFNMDVYSANLILTSAGCTILGNPSFTVLPPQGHTAIDKAKNVIIQLKEKYPELGL